MATRTYAEGQTVGFAPGFHFIGVKGYSARGYVCIIVQKYLS